MPVSSEQTDRTTVYTDDEIKQQCYDELLKRFLHLPDDKMMKALFSAILEDMVRRRLS